MNYRITYLANDGSEIGADQFLAVDAVEASVLAPRVAWARHPVTNGLYTVSDADTPCRVWPRAQINARELPASPLGAIHRAPLDKRDAIG